jgi:hypothetical protein
LTVAHPRPDEQAAARGAKDAQTDPTRNPNGVYSGMTKRLALSDGKFAEVSNMPGDSRKVARLERTHSPLNDISREWFD